MNLLFDFTTCQPNSDGKYHGGGKYGKTVLLNLIKRIFHDTSINLFVLINKTKFLEEDISEVITSNSIVEINSSCISIENVIDHYRIDRFYTPQPYNFVDLDKIKCEIIGAIHGLRGLETKVSKHSLLYQSGLTKYKTIIKMLLYSINKKKQLKHFEKILSIPNLAYYVVSNHTKFAIKSFFPKVNINNIQVFYSPDVTNHNHFTKTNNSNYFLMVSGSRWIKNNLRAAIALDQIFTDYPEIGFKVVITGVTDKRVYLKQLSNVKNFILKEYVEEEELNNLYGNAFAFIYPTLNEGFGYPPLEAMRFGIPVVTAAFSAVPEVCGNAVLYTNPYLINEIKTKITTLIFDKELYKRLQVDGRKRFEMILDIQSQDLERLINYIIS